MKKIGFLAALVALSFGLLSCSNGDDNNSTAPVMDPYTGDVPTFAAGETYKSADNAFDGTSTVTVTMTSATAGSVSAGGDAKSFTLNSTNGLLTYTGSGDTKVSHIIKVGEKIYAAGGVSLESSTTLTGVNWSTKQGVYKFNTDNTCTNSNVSGSFTYETSGSFVAIKNGSTTVATILYAGNKLFNIYAELTKQPS